MPRQKTKAPTTSYITLLDNFEDCDFLCIFFGLEDFKKCNVYWDKKLFRKFCAKMLILFLWVTEFVLPDQVNGPYSELSSLWLFLTFTVGFWIPIISCNFNFNLSNILDLWNPQKQAKKAFCSKNCSELSLFE